MATSPDYLRLASNVAASLVDTVFDSLREAVAVVDARPKHFPLVLANVAARNALGADCQVDLLEASLFGLLSPASASVIEDLLSNLTESRPEVSTLLTWRCGRREVLLRTEVKLLATIPGQRLVMLTFAPSTFMRELPNVLDQLPFDILILDAKFNVAYANAGAVRASGVTVEEVIGACGLKLAPLRALPNEVYERALESCQFHDDAVECHSPSGLARFFEMDVQPWRDASGIVGLIILFNAASRPGTATTLQGANEHRLRALTENARDIITVAAPDGRLQYISGGVRNALGFTSEERNSSSIFELAHPEDSGTLQDKFRQLTAGEIDRFCLEYRVLHKDGTYRWLEAVHVSALHDPLIRGVVINSRDITERKHAEYRLAQREEVFRLAADAVDGVIFEWDLKRGIVHRSQGVFEILGLEPEDLAPEAEAWMERIHPLDLPVFKRQIGLALLQGRGWTTTYRIRDVRGRYRSMLERALVQRAPDGEPLRAIGCSVDVSEIRRLTDLLIETQRTAGMGGWEYSYATRELTWTDEMFRIFETTPDEFVVSWESMLERLSEESRARFHAACARAEVADGQLDLELEITTLKGHRIWVRMIGHLERLETRPFRAFGSLQNIQSQKIARIALENNTRWLKLSMDMAQMQGWRWDKETNEIEYANHEGHHGHLRDAFPDLKSFMARVHPTDRVILIRAFERAFEQRSEAREQFRMKDGDGRYRTFATVARPLFDAAGEPQGLVGVTQDVTPRVESEAQLRRSEQLLRATTTNTVDLLLLVDTDLRIRFINKPIAGKPIEEIVGTEISSVLPEYARGGVLGKLRQVLATGESATYEFESQSGPNKRYLEHRAVLVRDSGVATGISISARDITERRRLEQEILEVSTRERQAVGRDLHDGLGQELTGVALMLRGLARRIERDAPGAVGSVNEIVALVNQSIESARSLARGLLPVRKDSGGLPFALSALAARSRELYGFEVNFRAEVRPQLTLSEASASHLYRIAQEAITNAARHGHASRVDILLTVTKHKYVLEISDDGAGIVEPRAPETGMGLRIMKYRAGMIGAKFEIGCNLPRGTVVRVVSEQPADLGEASPDSAYNGGNEQYGR